MYRLVLLLLLVHLAAISGIHQVTYGENLDDEPAWSPDGQKIVFVREIISTGYIDIYMKNINISGPATRITNDLNLDYGPCWLPDGTKIAYSSTRNGIYGTWIKDIETMEETYLSDGVYPCWSLEGDFIALNKGSGSEWNVWKRYVNSGIEIQLTFETGQNTKPDVSNDGTKIAFEHGDVNPGIWVVSSEGGTITQLPVSGYRPRWSPDGNKICFHAGSFTSGIYIYIYDIPTGQLTNTHVEGMFPDWSVQGDKIAFKHIGDIYYMDYPLILEPTSLGRIKARYR